MMTITTDDTFLLIQFMTTMFTKNRIGFIFIATIFTFIHIFPLMLNKNLIGIHLCNCYIISTSHVL